MDNALLTCDQDNFNQITAQSRNQTLVTAVRNTCTTTVPPAPIIPHSCNRCCPVPYWSEYLNSDPGYFSQFSASLGTSTTGEIPLDLQMLVFTGKKTTCTGKIFSCRFLVSINLVFGVKISVCFNIDHSRTMAIKT